MQKKVSFDMEWPHGLNIDDCVPISLWWQFLSMWLNVINFGRKWGTEGGTYSESVSLLVS